MVPNWAVTKCIGISSLAITLFRRNPMITLNTSSYDTFAEIIGISATLELRICILTFSWYSQSHTVLTLTLTLALSFWIKYFWTTIFHRVHSQSQTTLRSNPAPDFWILLGPLCALSRTALYSGSLSVMVCSHYWSIWSTWTTILDRPCCIVPS